MANISVGWEVDGIISAERSVAGMLRVVESKTIQDSGTFWTWEGLVSPRSVLRAWTKLMDSSNIHGDEYAKVWQFTVLIGLILYDS